MPGSVDGSLSPVGCPHLAKDVTDMAICGVNTDHQFRGDFSVPFAQANEAQHFHFSLAQPNWISMVPLLHKLLAKLFLVPHGLPPP
jgi:hypothetical protein